MEPRFKEQLTTLAAGVARQKVGCKRLPLLNVRT